MVKVKSYRTSDVHFFQHSVYHANNGLISAHVFASTFGNSQDYRRIQFLCCLQNGFGPFQVVNVELAYCIVAGFLLCRAFL